MGTVIKTIPEDLDVASRYTVRVRSINSLGISSNWSEAMIVSTMEFSQLSIPMPENLTVSSAPLSVVARWTPVTDPGFSYYEIYVNPGTGEFEPSEDNLTGIMGQGNTFIITQYWDGFSYNDLIPYLDYSVKIRAISVTGVPSEYTPYAWNIAGPGGGDGGPGGGGDKELVYAMPGDLIVESGLARWYAPYNATITAVRASVGSAPTGASIIVDVLKNGVSVMNDRPTIAPDTYTDLGGPVDPNILVGDYITIDVVQVGTTYVGGDLTVQVLLE
jgi:hypothetical protein